MPAPFDYAHVIAIHLGFVDVDAIIIGFAKDWRLADWSFADMDDAKDKLDEFYKAKEWKIRPESIIEWSHAVVYAGYDTSEVPYEFGTKVTLTILLKRCFMTVLRPLLDLLSSIKENR